MSDGLPTQISVAALPPAQKSAIRRWYDQVKDGGAGSALARAKMHASAGGHAIRAGGEGLIIGAALGAAHAELPHGLDFNGKIPIDAAFGATALAASIALAGEETHHDLRNAGATAVGIFSFRKVHDFVAAKKAAKGDVPGSVAKKAGAATDKAKAAVHGEDDADYGEDPIVAAARFL